MAGRKYVVETKRYIGEDGKTHFDSWVTDVEHISVGSSYISLSKEMKKGKRYTCLSLTSTR